MHHSRPPIAIVGMACRFPGGDDLRSFWDLLEAGKSAIAHSSSGAFSDRFARIHRESFTHDALQNFAFITEIEKFDAEFFSIAPVEAQLLDPQQRMLLETSWEALEDAGIPPPSLHGSLTGVYAGISHNDYSEIILQSQREAPNLYGVTGNCFSTASGRVSYVLGFKGPAIATDTACSSSLVATHQAVTSLQEGEVNVALVGGVSVILSPTTSEAFANAGMLSPTGRCWTFDEAADGFMRGEGCAVLILKRLEDAEASGDRIWAVIRGSAINQDGASKGLWVPDVQSQERVIEDALDRAGVAPSTINYLEAHGTGTRVGDPVELHAASAVYGRERDVRKPLMMGSVKTNIGHLSAGAGVAGLVKVVLAMNHGLIPKHLNFQTPTSQVDWDTLSVQVTSEPVEWIPQNGKPLRAGINSFGFSGTNAHVIVESYRTPNGDGISSPVGRKIWIEGARNGPIANQTSSAESPAQRHVRFLPVSGKTEPALRALVEQYLAWIENQPQGEGAHSWLSDLAWSAAIGRTHFHYRAGIPFDDVDSLRRGLERIRASSEPIVPKVANRVGFLYTGQASQWVDMGRELYESEPVFQSVLDRCDQLLSDDLTPSILDVMFGKAPPEYLNRPAWMQPAIYALECALTALWKSLGIHPDVVFGHSLGELAAAEGAGVYTLEDGVRFAALRGQLFGSLPSNGAMAAVFAPINQVSDVVRNHNEKVSGPGVTIAAQNGAHQVLSGLIADIEAISGMLEKDGLRVQRLRTTHAYHSPLIEPILEDIERMFDNIPVNPADTDFLSCVTGQVMTSEDRLNGQYWSMQARESVAFEKSIKTLAESGVQILIEVGPHSVLGPMAAMAWPEVEGQDPIPVIVSSLYRPSDKDPESLIKSKQAFVAAVAQVYEAGGSLDFQGLFHHEHRQRIALPDYPFQRRRHWIATTTTHIEYKVGGHPLIGVRHESPTGEIRFENELSPTSIDWLAHHIVFDRVVVPAAMYGSMIVSAVLDRENGYVIMEDMQLHAPLILSNEEDPVRRRVELVLGPSMDGPFQTVNIYSRSSEDSGWIRHISGLVKVVSGSPSKGEGMVDLNQLHANMSPIDAQSTYEEKAGKGVELGSAFQVLQHVWVGKGESLAEVFLGEDESNSGFPIHPILLDGCFQAVSAARGLTVRGQDHTYLPFGWDHLWLSEHMPDQVICHVQLPEDLTNHSNSDQQVLETHKADLRIYSPDGKIIGEMTGFTTKRATAASLGSATEGFKDMLHEVIWRHAPESGRIISAGFLVEPGSVKTKVPAYTEYLQGEGVSPSARQAFLEDLEWLARGYALRSLEQLGWKREKGTSFFAADLPAQLQVVDTQGSLFKRMLEMLIEGGVLKVDFSGSLEVVIAGEDALPHGAMNDPVEAVKDLVEKHAHGRYELSLLKRCGDALPKVLRAQTESLDLLFGNDQNALDFYWSSPGLRAANRMLTEALAILLSQRPEGRKIRVLEVGAGTGATTEWVMKEFPTGKIEYCYTDISAGFFADAERRFGSSDSGVEYRVLNIERDPVDQGFVEHSYDLVIAANVLHATRNLGECLTHCRQLLAPSGQLIALESLRPRSWLDLTFGQLDGWWRFEDSYRFNCPLLQPEIWERALRDTGFMDAQILGQGDSGQTNLWDRAVILARQPEQIKEQPGRWILIGDEAGVAEELANQLAVRGCTVVLILNGDDDIGALDQGSGVIHLRLDIESRKSWRSFLEALPNTPPLMGIVHLLSVDGHGHESTTRELASDLKQGFNSFLVLTQELLEADLIPSKGTWIITKGAQVLHHQRKGQLFGASLWGLGKVVIREANHLGVRMVDLDPSEKTHQDDLIQELLMSDSENQIAIRAGQRYTARLVRYSAGTPRLNLLESSGWRLEAADGPGMLQVNTISDSPLEPHQVRLSVQAAGLNFKDVLCAEGILDSELLGFEMCGRVIEIGSEVSKFDVGDLVIGLGPGSFANRTVTHEQLLVHAPEHLSICELATIPTVFTTAARCFELAQLTSKDRVLIHAAAGGVGLAAIQWAQAVGAEVFGTASTPKQSFVYSKGVKRVFDSRRTDFGKEILEATGGAGVTIVLNSLTSPGFIDASLSCLESGGRFVEISRKGIWTKEEMSAKRPDVDYFIFDLSEERQELRPHVGAALDQVQKKFVSGGLSPLIHTRFSMAEASHAMEFMRSAKHIGKIVLTPPSVTKGPLRKDRTYLVTGGLGGIGCEVAKWLTDKEAGTIVLNGRRSPDPEAVKIIDQLRKKGANVVVEIADVANAGELDAMLDRLDVAYPPLAGIFHSVGVLLDASLQNQDWERCRQVLFPKVLGAWHLHLATRASDLDFFVLFSSMAGVLGNTGQANHAAANVFLDQLALHRRSIGLAGQSIQWGAWSGLGVAEELRDQISQGMKARGVGWIRPDQGISALDHLLMADPTTIAVSNIDWPRYNASLGSPMPLLKELLPEDTKRSSTSKDGSVPLLAKLRTSTQDRKSEIQFFIQGEVQSVLRLPSTPSVSSEFRDLGMDSLMAVELRNRINRALSGEVTVSNTAVFDHPDASRLAQHIDELLGEISGGEPYSEVLIHDESPVIPEPVKQIQISRLQEPVRRDQPRERISRKWAHRIAIIGMSCRFPSAPSLSAYWDLLNGELCAIRDQRPDLNPLRGCLGDSTNGEVRVQRGAFIERVDGFDPEFFGIAPGVADGMDPESRLILETAWQALEDAGVHPDSLIHRRTGIYLGVSPSEYQEWFADGNEHRESTGDLAVRRLVASLKIEGPTLVINAGGASSIVALHRACGDLLSGEIELAIVGAASTMLSVRRAEHIGRRWGISGSGQCNAFDAAADGFVRGEGCGVVLLKRFKDAEADKDRIWSVICGSASTSSMSGAGVTLPDERVQRRVMEDAYASAGVNPSEVDYFEAHGAGSALTDPVEVRAAAAVFGREQTSPPLLIGSVKSNIGHLEEASGMAGLIKVVLALAYGSIPSQYNFQTPTQRIDWGQLPMRVNSTRADWPKEMNRSPRAGLSALDQGGTATHVVLEQYASSSINDHSNLTHQLPVGLPQSVKISDSDELLRSLNHGITNGERLQVRHIRLLPLSAKSNDALKDLAQRYLSHIGRLVDSEDATTQALLSDMAWTAGIGRDHFRYRAGIVFNGLKSLREGLLSVQENGANHPPMRGTGIAFVYPNAVDLPPQFARDLYECEPVARSLMKQCDELFHRVNGRSLLTHMFKSDPSNSEQRGNEWTYSAIYVLECALTALWKSLDIDPNVVVGHGIGEVAAGYAAKILRLGEGLRIVMRLDSIRQKPKESKLIVEDFGLTLNENPLLGPSNISVISGSTGQEVAPEEILNRGYWSRLALDDQPSSSWTQMDRKLGADHVIEIGLNPLADDSHVVADSNGSEILHALNPSPILSNLDQESRGEFQGMSYQNYIRYVASAYESGLSLSFSGLFAGETRSRISLPSYPFQHRSCWIDRSTNPKDELSSSATEVVAPES